MSLRAYLRGCAHKKRFRTEAIAEKHGRKWGQRPYECPSCGRWHLSSKPKSKEGSDAQA